MTNEQGTVSNNFFSTLCFLSATPLSGGKSCWGGYWHWEETTSMGECSCKQSLASLLFSVQHPLWCTQAPSMTPLWLKTGSLVLRGTCSGSLKNSTTRLSPKSSPNTCSILAKSTPQRRGTECLCNGEDDSYGFILLQMELKPQQLMTRHFDIHLWTIFRNIPSIESADCVGHRAGRRPRR